VVEFEEEAVDIEAVKECLRDVLVAAGRHPAGLVVAAAEMGADRHVGRAAGGRGVEEFDITQMLLVALLADHDAAPGVVKKGEARVVELQISAAELREPIDL